jgi:hypothetical protein
MKRWMILKTEMAARVTFNVINDKLARQGRASKSRFHPGVPHDSIDEVAYT